MSPAPRLTNTPSLSRAEQDQVKEMMLHMWEEDTRVSYGAGLLMWHCFYNGKGAPEEGRALATQVLLLVFIVYLASTYSGRMIVGYLSRVRAWHILHGLPWALEDNKMTTMLQAVEKLMPSTSRKKK